MSNLLTLHVFSKAYSITKWIKVWRIYPIYSLNIPWKFIFKWFFKQLSLHSENLFQTYLSLRINKQALLTFEN